MTYTQATPIANTDMAAIWDGEEGDDWTDNADRYDATDRWIAARFHAEVAIAATDLILDIGCGTGTSTRTVARKARSGQVLGIDLSSRMLEYARGRSQLEGLTNVEYVRGDAQVHPFPSDAFDVAISTFGAMFFVDPVAAFTNIGRALRSGGRIALLSWQRFEDNRWLSAILDAVADGRDLPAPAPGEPGPFGLAVADDVRQILDRSGLVDVRLVPIAEPFCLGSDAEDAWEFVSTMGLVRGLTEELTPEDKARAHDNLRALVADHETAEGVLLESAAWLITAGRP